MSRLLANSEQYRKREFARNTSTLFTPNDPYNTAHSKALSDGDEKGKGENSGSIGGLTDIQKRHEGEAKNMYNKNKPYNDSRA
jgi:hypothetical protein